MKALKARSGFPKKPSRCQEFIRLASEEVVGNKFDDEFAGTARETGMNFIGTKYQVPREDGCIPGDLLYKLDGSGGSGHVAMRIPGNKVVENSSIHWNGRDARGTRTMKEYGHFDVIVRLA
jgi:hypothetical protein